MYVSSIPVACYYNGNILRIETYVKYVGNKAVIVPLDVSVECTFEQLGDMIYSRTTIDKQRFKLVLNCKYLLKSGNRSQHFPIWDDSSVYRMLNMVNSTSIEEIELYIEVVRVKPQVNQSMGGHIDLLVREIIMLHNLPMVVGLVVVQYRILEYMEMMKTALMKKLMINLMKMLMMNLMET